MNYKKLLLLSLILVLPVTIRAQYYKIDGIFYSVLSNSEKTVEVTEGVRYSGSIVIPQQITIDNDVYSVTAIGERAFTDCTGLTSITIPESVTTIRRYAFYGCSGLTSITIPESITSISEYTFAECIGLTSITIPESVASIGEYAFAGCSGLTSITIPENVKYIPRCAFYDCSGLTSITITSITGIEHDAFVFCSNLNEVKVIVTDYSSFCNNNIRYGIRSRSLNISLIDAEGNEIKAFIIPKGVTSIDNYTFYRCTGLASIVIPESVTSIGSAAFYGCTGLTSITIPESVTSIGDAAFADCTGLTFITIPESVTSIGGDAFSGCTGLTSITIPESVTSIGNPAFDGCKNISSVKIYAKIVGPWFSGLTSLKEVTLGDEVTTIGEYAFKNCSSLTSIDIPNSVTSIGYAAFYGCTGLTSIAIPESVISIGIEAFFSTPWFNDQPDGLVYAGLVAYAYKGSMSDDTEIVLKKGTKCIATDAFSGCSGLISITLPESVSSIGSSAFYGCTGLTSITIPESVTSIGSSAFVGCKLEKVFAYNPLTKIASDSFSDRMFQHTMLYIPYGTWGQAIFEGDWYRFNNIREVTTTQQSLSQNRAYTMMNAKSFGYAVYNEYSDDINLVKAFYSVDEDDPNSSWQIIDRKDGKSVMNIGTKKYLNVLDNGELSLSEIPVTLNVSDSDNGIKFNGSEEEWMFVTNNRVQVNGETKVNTPEETHTGNSEYYSIDGKPLAKPVNGLNIIRTQDGTFRKEIK